MSEVTKRILSGFVLSGIITAALFWNSFFYWILPLLFTLLFSQLAAVEFFRLAERGSDGRPLKTVGHTSAFIVTLAFYLMLLQSSPGWTGPEISGKAVVSVILLLSMLVMMSWQMMFRPLAGALYSVSVTLTGVLYTSVTLSHTLLYFSLENGVFYLVFIITATVFTDIGAYFAGKYLGKHNAGLKVSPKKTYEGFAGGIAASFLSAFIFQQGALAAGLIGNQVFSLPALGAITLLLSALTIIGDLTESMLKRDASVKDSASIIPGHGGMLDLIDALLFTVPVGYYLVIFLSGEIVI